MRRRGFSGQRFGHGMDSLITEVHTDPGNAFSGAAQPLKQFLSWSVDLRLITQVIGGKDMI